MKPLAFLFRLCLFIPGMFAGSMILGLQPLQALPGQATDRDQASEEPSSDVEPSEVIFETATVWDREVSDTGSSISVLSRTEIEALNIQTVAELLPYVPGIFVADPGSRAGLAAAQIRGGDPNFTLVLLDGIPLNDATDQFGGAVNLNALPVSEIEQVEIVRGPLSSYYGSSALGGAVNIVTRRPARSESGLDVRASAGSSSLLEGAASIASDSEKNNFFIGASWEEEEGRVGDDSFEQLNLQGRSRHVLGRVADLQLTGRLSSWQGDDYAEGSGGPIYGSGETRSSDHEELSLGLRLLLGSSSKRHQLSARFYDHEIERTTPSIGFVVPDITEDTSYSRILLGWAYPVWQSDSAQLSIGAGLDRETGDNTSLYAGFLPGSYQLGRTTPNGLLEFTLERGRWFLEVGGRVDVPEDADVEFSPRLAGSIKLRDNTRVRGSVSRAFKLPSFFALGSPPPLGGNPDLESETALGADLGLDHTFVSSRLSIEASAFFIRFENLIDFLFEPFPMLVNLSSVDSKGAEFNLDWDISDRMNLVSNLTWQDVENRATSETLRNRPDWTGGVRYTWRPRFNLSWEIDARWVSERRDEQITSERTSVSSYYLVGSALRYRFNTSWAIDARVDNLTDHQYETFIGFPGPDRSLRLGLRYSTRFGDTQ